MRVIEIARKIHRPELSAISGGSDGLTHLSRAMSADAKFPAGWVRVKGECFASANARFLEDDLTRSGGIVDAAQGRRNGLKLEQKASWAFIGMQRPAMSISLIDMCRSSARKSPEPTFVPTPEFF